MFPCWRSELRQLGGEDRREETLDPRAPSAGLPVFPGSRYDGPVTITTWTDGERVIRIVRPADPDRLLDDPQVQEWNRRDDYMPYWAYLWPGACLLAGEVARAPWRELLVHHRQLLIHHRLRTADFEVLEIGCGVGLAGLVALSRGLSVCFTDYDSAALEFVARSAAENGFDSSRFATRLLDWRDPPDERYPVILGSDLLYERRLVPLLAKLLHRMLAPGGLGLIACPGRSSAEGFADSLADHGLTCTATLGAAPSDEGKLVRGILYQISWSDEPASPFRETASTLSTKRLGQPTSSTDATPLSPQELGWKLDV
jgi:predicted nicotinamide N-methyase